MSTSHVGGGVGDQSVKKCMSLSVFALCGATLFSVSASEAADNKSGQSGIASHYTHAGRKTASGERVNAGALTAAHRSLPFGTRVQVTNTRNGRSVVVRINDRGPFVRGRVIDLTPAAARALGFRGLAPVALAVLR
jgi:rare lipoprotein A